MEKKPPEPASPFWSTKEAARYLKISPVTLYEWCRIDARKKRPCRLVTNPPPFRRMARNVIRFPIEEFKAWANQLDYPK
jgi:hypothetical protein